ncbi:MAG: caspase family protein [Desulfobacterales bacterium]|nr:caspase family protein [Desulfobacterales bacterium]
MLKKIVFITLILILAANISNIISANAANRIALVIGNSNYKSSPLNNPVNDASDISSVLKRLGFDVILKKNASKKEMLDAFRQFGRKLSASEIGIFYFAGHGMQIDGTNYLIPVNNNIKEESEVEFEAIDAGRILNKMEKAGNPLNIVILDACRDNPFKRSFRTSKKGFAQMDAPLGTVSNGSGSLRQ